MAGRPSIRAVPGQSNLSDPAKRQMENILIRRMRERSRMKSMGFGVTAQDQQIARTKKRLYG